MKNSDCKILIVDDMKANLHLLGTILNREGYKVSAVDSGIKALNYLEKNSVDLVLLDYMMPEMDGIEVCCKIKNNEIIKNTPVIFVTAKTEETDISAAFDAGGEDYILKPIKKLEVLQRVKNSLQRNYAINELNREIDIKTKLMAMLSHDLRSPISNIVSAIELNQQNILSESDTLEFLSKLAVSAKSTSLLLENILHWINSQKNDISVSLAPFRIYKILENLTNVLQGSYESKNIELSIECKENLEIISDVNILYTVIRNIVSNAIKFTPENGSIRVSAYNSGDATIIKIRDSGIGISKENIQKILDTTTNYTTNGTQNESGTGLGLNICFSFTKILNGELTIVSETDKGTEMRISIPHIDL